MLERKIENSIILMEKSMEPNEGKDQGHLSKKVLIETWG